MSKKGNINLSESKSFSDMPDKDHDIERSGTWTRGVDP